MAEDIQRSMGITTVGDRGDPTVKQKNPAGPLKLATAIVNSDNRKTGKTLTTYAAQVSCPNGENSSYKCPFYGAGCYAENGPAGITTHRLNKAAGLIHYKDPSAKFTPEQVAEDEAAALSAVYQEWKRNRITPFIRLHVVGDAVSRKAAQIISDALRPFAEAVSSGVKNIWAYTHAWRDVPRSAWGSHVSILASCDNVEDLPDAHAAGYACAVVVPRYVQAEGKKVGASYKLDSGFTIIPCPFEVGRIVAGHQLQCRDCKLCMREDLLRQNKSVIAFAAHGAGAEKISKRLAALKPAQQGEE